MSLKYKGQKRNAKRSFGQQEVKTFGLEFLLSRIFTRYPSLHGTELTLKYADTNVCIELPDDDLDSFVDMTETAKDLQGKTLRLLNSTSSNVTTNCTGTFSLFAKLRENVGECACS